VKTMANLSGFYRQVLVKYAQVSNKWIKCKPRSSDLSSLSHGYGDPKLGGSDYIGLVPWEATICVRTSQLKQEQPNPYGFCN
jgi:hypothetical protein